MRSTYLFTRTVAGSLPADFLDARLGQQVVLADVGRDATASLLTWDDLNDILATRALLAPRLRLSRRGTELPVESYARVAGEGGERREVIQADELFAALRDGATLIVDAMESLHDPVAAAAEDLVRFVREPVQANLYATWGTSQGFNAHWDDHDTFIVQVRGSKHWTVHGPGRPFPMRRDVVHDHSCPDAVVWEGVLGEGQVLHVPRGWWHEVRGAGDVSIHLTFGFGRRTGVDWGDWVLDRLRHHEVFRRDLPRFAGHPARRAHERALRACLDEVLAASSLEAFFRHRDELVPRRNRFSLPWPVSFSTPGDSETVEFTPVFAPRVEEHDGRIALAAGRKTYTFAPVLGALLHALVAQRQLSCGELRQRSGLDADTFSAALEILVEQHLVTIARRRPAVTSQPADAAPAAPSLATA